MAITPSQTVEGQHGEKRLRRHPRLRVQRTSTQSSPVVIVLAVVAAVLLVIGAIAGAMALNKPTPSGETNRPAVPAKEAPTPPGDRQQ